MITKIVAHVHLFNLKEKVFVDCHLTLMNRYRLNLAVFILALNEDVLEEVVVVLLHLLVGHVGQVGAVSGLGRVLGVDVEVGEEHRLGERGLVVDPGATVTMGASSYKQKHRHKNVSFKCAISLIYLF